MEHPHCYVSFDTIPTLSTGWIKNQDVVSQVLRSIILPSTGFKKRSQQQTYLGNEKNKLSEKIKVSNITGLYFDRGNEKDHDSKTFGGLSFAWLRNVQDIMKDLSGYVVRTAALTIEERIAAGLPTDFSKIGVKDEEEEDEDERTETGEKFSSGITDIANRCQALLRPNLEEVVYESLDVAIKAATMVAGDLLQMERRDDG